MRGILLFVFILSSITAPSLTFLPKGTNSWTDFLEWFKIPRNNFLPQLKIENKSGSGDIRKVIDVTIGSEGLSTKFTSGVNTFAAYTGISATIVAVVTVAIIVFPFLILFVYISLVVLFPDPGSPVKFERDIAVTMKHLKYVATDVEDRVFDFLEEITDPNKYTQENQSPQSYNSDYHNNYHLGLKNSVQNHHGQYTGPLDSYVQYTYNQNNYRPSVKTTELQNSHWFNNANNVRRQMQGNYYSQNPYSKNLVVQSPAKHFQYPTKQQAYQPQKVYFISNHNHSKETRRLNYGQPNLYLHNGGHRNNVSHGSTLGPPLRNSAFDPSFNVGPIRSPTVTQEKPLLDQRGETPHSIEQQLKVLAQLNSNHKIANQIGSFSSFPKDQKFHPSPLDGSIVPRNVLVSNLNF